MVLDVQARDFFLTNALLSHFQWRSRCARITRNDFGFLNSESEGFFRCKRIPI